MSFPIVIDTSSCQLGQVNRINITDQGIFRVFYNDICGNMYCGLSRESNYKQVVLNSAYKRKDISSNLDPVIDNSGMNAPFYGGTYHENELEYIDNSSNFYIYRYPTLALETDLIRNTNDRGPISFFTEVQVQKYKHQGIIPVNGNTRIYNENGLSPGLNSKQLISFQGGNNTIDYNWLQQAAFGYCTSEIGGYALDPSQGAIIATELGLTIGDPGVTDFTGSFSTKGLYAYSSDDTSNPNQAFFGTGGNNKNMKAETASTVYRPGIPASTTMALYVPDLMELNPAVNNAIPTLGVTNKGLNTGAFTSNPIGWNSSLAPLNKVRFITEPWQTDISNNIDSSGPSSFNVKYYISSKRPPLTRLDENGEPISPFTNNSTISDTDSYYKGRWSIFVDVKSQVRDPTNPTNFIDNDTSGNIYISRSNRATKPIINHILQEHHSNSSIGEVFDISNIFVDLDLDISKNSTINNGNFNNIYAKPYFVYCSSNLSNITWGSAPYDLTSGNVGDIATNNFGALSGTPKYCKIRVNPNNNDWATNQIHLVYMNEYFAGPHLAYYSINVDLDPNSLEHYRWNTNTKVGDDSGYYPSMDVDSTGKPCVAFYGNCGTTNGGDNQYGIHFIKSNIGSSNTFNYPPDNPSDWSHTLIDIIGQYGGTYYNDLSNNQPINLKVSPYDDSVHITYQKKNTDGTYSLMYWTDSTNTMDISEIDSSLNYVGMHTQGLTIDDLSANVEVYWDLSQCNCIFSRDYTRKNQNSLTTPDGLTSPELQVTQLCAPYGSRIENGLGRYDTSIDTGWRSGVIYNSTFLDKIYIIMTIKTPTSFDVPGAGYCLFALAGDNPSNALPSNSLEATVELGSTYGGCISFGVFSTSTVLQTRAGTAGIPFKNGNPAPFTDFKLSTNRNYQLEFYVNRTNLYALIRIKDLLLSQTTTFEYYDVSNNGGIQLKDGNLSIGSKAHIAPSSPLKGTIFKMSIYATDISNVPTFDLSRNEGILTEVTETPFSSYSDFSGVEIEPDVMKYKIVNAKNSLNLLGSTGGESKIKETILHDVYYYERINTQNDLNQENFSKNFVNVFDKFTNLVNGYYEIWAAGYYAFGSSSGQNYPKLWRSVDGGENWTDIENYPTGVSGEQILDIKTHIDTNGGRWVFVCGDNYLLRVTNDYQGNTPNGVQLGTVWKTIGDAPGPGNGEPGGNYYTLLNSKNIKTHDFNCIKITQINSAQSTAIFPAASAPATDDFHVWVGTETYNPNLSLPAQPIVINNIRIQVGSSYYPGDIFWFVINSSGQTVICTNNSSTNSAAVSHPLYNASVDQGAGAPYNKQHQLPVGTYTVQLFDCYDPYPPGAFDGWDGDFLQVFDNITSTQLAIGTVTQSGTNFDASFNPTILTFTIPSTSIPAGPFSYPLGLPGYKDMLIRGNYIDYSNNQLDYSYNIVTNAILDTSNNPTKTFNESFNTFSFGGEYQNNGTNNTEGFNYGIVTTDSYIYQTKDGGLNWDKRLGIDRVSLTTGYIRGTMGSYVDKNIKLSTGLYDNSGIYIQTSTEPWNEIPGFTVAYNDGDYDLSFTPIDSTGKKTLTWSPELGDYENFWNVNTIDNSGSIVKYRLGGGNNLKVYIDSASSVGTEYQNKQKMYTYDSLIPGIDSGNGDLFYDENPVLYSRDSELENKWQRINPSIVDPSLNTYIISGEAKGLQWDSFSDYDCSYSIVNLPFASRFNNQLYNPVNSSVDLNNYAGFYKLSKTPFTPFLKAVQSQNDLFSANLTVQYRGGNSTGILNPPQFSSRLDFVKLNIKSYFYFRKKVSANASYSNYVLTDGPPLSSYTKTVIDLEPGATFQFKVRLENDHGFGWYSNESDEIVIPAPSPELNDLAISSKIFENVVSWEPFIETIDNQNSLQTVFSYNIEKQYVDENGVWVTDISFTDFYQDLSGTLGPSYGSLNGTKWTGPFNPVTGLKDLNDVSFCSFSDTDLSLNGVYRYNITAFPSNVNTTSSNSFTISNQTSSGKPKYITHQYNPIDASFNILWTIDSDISSNTDVTWDVSWQEIRKDSPQYDNSGVVQITDPYIGQSGIGKTRQVTIPLLNNHLQADASYNYQIKVDYSNNTIITDYVPSSANIQIPLYSGDQPYDPSGIKTYYNYQQPPVLNEANYNTTTDLLDINWTATNIPTTPFYYDVSMSNITAGRTDVSYNFIVYNGTSLTDPSNNGKNIYPGSYVVRVRAAYGDSVPVDISLFSEWSAPVTFTNDVPEHLPSNLKIIPYNFNNQPGNYTDVSYVKLTWDSPSNDDYSLTSFPIPQRYTLIRKTASKDYNYVIDFSNNDIPRTSNFYNDMNYPLAHFNPTVPRIYRYDLSANYDPPPFILNYPLPTLQNNLGEVNYTLTQNFSTGTVQFIPMTGATLLGTPNSNGDDVGGGSGYIFNSNQSPAGFYGGNVGNNIVTNYTIALATSQLSIGQHTLVSRPIIPNVKYQLKITLDGTEYNYTDISFNGFGGYFTGRMNPPVLANGVHDEFYRMKYYDGAGNDAYMGNVHGNTYGTRLEFQFTTWLPNGRAAGKTGTLILNNFYLDLSPWEFSVNGGPFQSFTSGYPQAEVIVTGPGNNAINSGGYHGGRWIFVWADASVPHAGHPFSVGDKVVIKYTKPSVDDASTSLAVQNQTGSGSLHFAQTQQTLAIEVISGN